MNEIHLSLNYADALFKFAIYRFENVLERDEPEISIRICALNLLIVNSIQPKKKSNQLPTPVSRMLIYLSFL